MRFSEKLSSTFKENGYKLTPQRFAVFNVLDGNKNHPTAEEVYLEVKRSLPTVSFATIYNILSLIQQIGEVQELSIDKQSKHFDPNTFNHHHAMCTECRHIIDIFQDYKSSIAIPDILSETFSLKSCQVNLYGICSNCSESKNINKKNI